MKKLLKLCAAILAVVTVLSLAGCSARNPITADDFKKQAEAAGFKVTDNSAQSTSVSKYFSAVKAETGTEIVYILCGTDAAATEMYNSVKTSISAGTSGTSTNVDSSSYNKYTLLNGELTHTLTRMGSTIVYGKTTATHKNQVDDFFKTIKY